MCTIMDSYSVCLTKHWIRIYPLWGFSVQPAPSTLAPNAAFLQILLKLPPASRNIVLAPVTFKVPSRLGPSIWKIFFALNVRVGEAQILW